MKLLVLCLIIFAASKAEPVGYPSGTKTGVSDVEIQQVEVIEIPWQEEPENPQQAYGPPKQEYGPPKQEYGPPKQEYGPPKQEYGPPKQEYGPPKQEYGPPKPVYGPPSEAPTTEADMTTTEVPTTTEYATTTEISGNATNATNVNVTRSGKLENDDITEKGAYYIYHPNGVLQRVVYATKDDARNMAYSAQLKYQNVESVNGPIYTYDPRTYVFQRINRR